MKFQETAIVYEKIKATSNMNDEALAIIGMTKEKIDAAILKCVSAGMSRKKAADVVFKMWDNAGR